MVIAKHWKILKLIKPPPLISAKLFLNYVLFKSKVLFSDKHNAAPLVALLFIKNPNVIVT